MVICNWFLLFFTAFRVLSCCDKITTYIIGHFVLTCVALISVCAWLNVRDGDVYHNREVFIIYALMCLAMDHVILYRILFISQEVLVPRLKTVASASGAALIGIFQQ